MPAILKIKDKEGKIYTIPAIRGEKGEDGKTVKPGKYLLLNENDEMSLDISDQLHTEDSRPVSGNVIKTETDRLQTQLTGKADIRTGTYTGTGLYGEENANVLTFPFVPKILFISEENATGKYLFWMEGMPYFSEIGGNTPENPMQIYMEEGNLVFWHTENAVMQSNATDVKYRYTALG